MRQHLRILLIKVYPNLHPVETLGVFGRDEAKAVDVLRVVEILPQEVKDQVRIDIVLVSDILVDGEDESPTALVLRIFPLWLDSLAEILNRVHLPPPVLHEVTECFAEYVSCFPERRRKLSSVLSWQCAQTYARSAGERKLYASI